MATSRGGENIFHALMMSLVDGDWVNMAKLYGYGLHRLQDNITWLRNAFETFGEQLSSTESAGSRATLTGIINVSEQAVPGVPGTGLDYQGGALLDGKTLTITTDLGLTTVTWPAGITTLSQMLAELASQAPTIGIGTTSTSRLQVSSPTLGGSSSISVGGSSFSILFGAVANSVTGGADPDDGASRIGVADIAGLGANTLRFYLGEIVDMVVSNTSDIATKVSKAGDTMTGGLTIDTADLNVLRSGGSGGNITAGGTLDVAGDAVAGGDVTVNDPGKGFKLAARTVTRSAPGAMSIDDFTGNDNGSFQATAVTIGKVRVPLYLPHGATLSAIRMLYAPNGGHVGLPAVRAKVEAFKTSLTTGLTVSIGVAEDDSANVAEYEQVHTIESGTLSEVVNRATHRYHALVTSEVGANAVAGGVFLGLSYDVLVSALDEG